MSVPPSPDQDLIRRRQRSGAIVTGLILSGLAVLIFLITMAKSLK